MRAQRIMQHQTHCSFTSLQRRRLLLVLVCAASCRVTRCRDVLQGMRARNYFARFLSCCMVRLLTTTR